MDIGIVSVRYAKALLRFATENKEEERVYKEMNALAGVFTKLPQMQAAMLNPVLTQAQKVELLKEACGGKADLTASVTKFIDLVTTNKRADLMMFIANSYITLYRRSKHIIKGRLIVPKAISDSVSKKLRDIVEQQTDSHVEFEVLVDKNIEGGFILEYDTYRLDGSLRTQLDRLHRALKN
ncbi:MAG: F0F1 ATP synthase subunit delta [Bacteroidales bacterium]|nr:F0F1 ATP synthase subunit delta [Bacteroidales bacterium]